jgi:hypothetical protein
MQRDCISWDYFQDVLGKLKRCPCCIAERMYVCASLAHLQLPSWPSVGFSDGLALLPISKCDTRDCCERRVNYRLCSNSGLSPTLLRTIESFFEDAHLPGKSHNRSPVPVLQVSDNRVYRDLIEFLLTHRINTRCVFLQLGLGPSY